MKTQRHIKQITEPKPLNAQEIDIGKIIPYINAGVQIIQAITPLFGNQPYEKTIRKGYE